MAVVLLHCFPALDLCSASHNHFASTIQPFNNQRGNDMKNIIERIAGGAKIARYLPKAVKSRLAVAALAALAAGGAWAVAPTATAVWEAGEFEETKNGYSIALNGNTIDGDGNIVIGESTTAGATVKLTDVNASGENAITVLYKYKTLGTGGTKFFVSTYLRNSAATAGEDIGAIGWSSSNYKWVFAAQLSSGSWKNWYGTGWNDAGSTAPFDNALSADGGYVLFAFQAASTAKVYTGSTLGALAGQSNSSITYSSTTYNGTMEYIGVGGPTGHATGSGYYGVWPGMTIEKIAIFVGNAYTNEDLADYMWPSIERYQKWSYAASSRILTWTTPSYAIDNCIPAPAASYTVFDISTATDTDTTYTGGAATSTTGANWHYFCYSSNAGSEYVAPGSVLRFVSGDYYKKSLAADYSPVTYGGIIVEEGATGYSFAEASRYSVLGDPTGATETWFEFNEDFTLGRSSGCHLTGTNNLSIASGKTFTIAGTTTKTATTAKSNILSGTAGGTLKLHGEGKLAATLTASGATLDYTDLPATSSSSTDAYIQGTVTVNANTVIALPSGATFPYFIATGISGALDSGTGVTIGGVAAPNYVAKADGSIIYSAPAEVTISSDATWGSGGLDGWTTDDATKNYIINVTGDATLTLSAAVSLNRLTLNVSEDVTLTISGGYTITAADCIYVTGGGEVATSTAPTFSGTVKGDGTIIYYGVRPTTTGTDVVFTGNAWRGTLWLQGYNKDASETATELFPQYWGSANSTIKWSGVAGYFNHNITCAAKWELEDLVENETTYYAIRRLAVPTSGGINSNSPIATPLLTGSGTFYDNAADAEIFRFASADGYTGNITMGSSAAMTVQFGATAENRSAGNIVILGGGNVTLSSGMTWTPKNGMKVNANGVLNVNTDATVKFTSQGMLGTLNIAQGKTLTAASDDAVSYNTGSSTVNVYGTLNFDTFRWTIGPNTVVNLYEGAIVKGTGDSNNSNAAMDFNVANGSTIHALGNATVSCTIRNNAANGTAMINVDAGKTLTFSGNLVGSYGFRKQGAGILKLTGSIAKLPTIEDGTVLLGGSKAWNFDTVRDLTGYALEAGSSIAITQILAEYRCGVTTVTGLDESIASITVNKYDGTTATLMRTDSTSTLTETPVTSGVACWYDFTFTNTVKSATGSSGSSTSLTTTDVSSFEYVTIQDYAQPTPNSYTAIPTYVRPYSGINLGSKTQFCVALFGTMPSPDNTVLLFLGDGYGGGALILASGTSANEAVLYYYTTGKVLTELKRMPASSCRTAPHLYVFQKVGDHQVDIYLDGKLSLSYVNNDITFTLNTGFQVASGYRGTPTGLSEISSSATSEPSAIAMTRIYDRLLTSAEITQLAIEWPYYSPNGDSSRTLDVGETTPDWVETGKWLFNNVGADAAAANSNVEFVNNAGAAASVAVNLNANTAYESLAVSGDNAVSFALKSGFTGKIVPGAATFSADTTVAYDAADFSSTRVEVADGKTLTFDVSSIVTANGNWPNAASVDRIQLTGIATLGTGATVAVTPATAGYWNLSAVEDGGYYYLSVTPGRANGEIYWQSGTYWNSTYASGDSPATFTTDAAGTTPTKYFVGDTVVIPTTTKRYFGPISDGAAIKFDCGGAIEVTKTDSLGYVFKNATVTVASGTTLNFVNSWNGVPPEVYGGTISGAGKVKVESGKTLTLSNGATLASETALTGAGEVVLAYVPTAQMTFDNNWTGTVKLPQFAADGAKLNFAGNSDSTVALAGITSGWLGKTSSQCSEVAPTLRLDGNVTITVMSTSWQYSFAKITGTGNLSFTSADAPASLAITEIADYTGTLNNSTTTALTVGRISLASAPAADTLLLATNGTGTVTVNAVYVNGNDSGMQVVYKEGGVYSPAATYVAEYGGVQYETVQEAINAAVEHGQTYAAVTILDPNATCPDGYYVDTENGNALAKYAAAAVTVGVTTTTQWFTTFQAAIDAAVADNQTTYAVAYADGTATVAGNSMFMLKPGAFNVTVTSSIAGYGDYAQGSEIPGYAGVYQYSTSPAAATFTWTGAAEDNLWATAGNWSSTDGTVSVGPANSLYTAVLDTAATIKLDGVVAIGTVNVGAAVTLQNSGAQHAVLDASSIVLTAAGASIAASGVSGHKMTFAVTPTTTVANSYVKTTTSGSTTTYTVATQPTVSDVAFEYGADYASATVTATVSDTTLDYYISWAGGEPVRGSVSGSGSQVTFDISGINHTTEYQSAAYSITAKDGETDVTTTGGSGTSVAADTTPWFSHDSSGLTGGTWATAVDLSEPATVADNKFTATAESTSSRVVLEFNVCFSSTSTDDVSGEAQAAIKLGEVNSVTTFMVLTNANEWAAISNAALTPKASEAYKVVLTIDYGSNTYKVDVGGCSLTNASGSASFPLAASKTSVQTIDFAGSGTLTSMKGNQVEGYMVVDKNGTRYATISDAIAAYTADPTIGPLTVLHDGTPLPGWSIVSEGGIAILKKLAKGFFFMAY